MAMYVKSDYDGFVCTVQVTSDTIDEIDLTAPDFRIDIINQFEAAAAAKDIASLIEERNAYEAVRDDSTWEYPNSIVPELTSATTYSQIQALYDDYVSELKYADPRDKLHINHQLSDIRVASAIANTNIDYIETGNVYSYTTKTEGGDTYSAIVTSATTHSGTGIADYYKQVNVPMLSITHNGSTAYDADTSSTSAVHGVVRSDVFANTDDEMLIRNGMQYWVSKDKKSLTFRFIPQLQTTYQFQSIVVICALDYQNVTRFEVCLVPRLITGDLQKVATTSAELPDGTPISSCSSFYGMNPPTDDPIIGSGEYTYQKYNTSSKEWETFAASGEYPRPDFIFNDDNVDADHLYLNNTPWTLSADDEYPQKVTSALTPLWAVPSTAYISEQLVSGGYNFDWNKFESTIYDVAALSSKPIPYYINGETAASSRNLEPIEVIETLVPTYTGTDAEIQRLNKITLKSYEIWQFIETSSNEPMFSQNQVKLTVAI